MRLRDELVHARMSCQVDDDVHRGIFDAPDASGDRGVMPGEIL